MTPQTIVLLNERMRTAAILRVQGQERELHWLREGR